MFYWVETNWTETIWYDIYRMFNYISNNLNYWTKSATEWKVILTDYQRQIWRLKKCSLWLKLLYLLAVTTLSGLSVQVRSGGFPELWGTETSPGGASWHILASLLQDQLGQLLLRLNIIPCLILCHCDILLPTSCPPRPRESERVTCYARLSKLWT